MAMGSKGTRKEVPVVALIRRSNGHSVMTMDSGDVDGPGALHHNDLNTFNQE